MPQIQVSTGELLDKWSILEIKLSQFTSSEKISIIGKEMRTLESVVSNFLLVPHINDLYSELKEVNFDIWKGMDLLYGFDKSDKDGFIVLTNTITDLNMRRAFVKRKIDVSTESEIMETKSFIDE
jgi:hypothetical protein